MAARHAAAPPWSPRRGDGVILDGDGATWRSAPGSATGCAGPAPTPSCRARVGYFSGLAVDTALWLGERIIHRAQGTLRWELYTGVKKSTGYQRAVLTGFRKVDDPRYYVDVAHFVSAWFELCARRRAARGYFLATFEARTLRYALTCSPAGAVIGLLSCEQVWTLPPGVISASPTRSCARRRADRAPTRSRRLGGPSACWCTPARLAHGADSTAAPSILT
jgi:hypothetical protein